MIVSCSMEPVSALNTPALSGREKQVLLGLARGLHDREVAEELGISLGTVRVYRARIQEKLRVRGLIPWIMVAWKLGLIDIEPIAQDALTQFEDARYRRDGQN